MSGGGLVPGKGVTISGPGWEFDAFLAAPIPAIFVLGVRPFARLGIGHELAVTVTVTGSEVAAPEAGEGMVAASMTLLPTGPARSRRVLVVGRRRIGLGRWREARP